MNNEPTCTIPEAVQQAVRDVTALDALRGVPPKASATVFDELRATATVSVGRAAQILGISRAYGYQLVKSGGLPVIRLGERRVRVPSVALLQMLEGEW